MHRVVNILKKKSVRILALAALPKHQQPNTSMQNVPDSQEDRR
jgi:hypothetical protein